MLDQAIQNFQDQGDAKALVRAIKAHFKIKKVAKIAMPYILGEVAVDKGLFRIAPFVKVYDNHFSYDDLFAKLGDDLFPAIQIGRNRYGVEFWLVLESGQVIMLHHDASFYEVAADVDIEDAAKFMKEFAKRGSLMKIDKLLELQEATGALDRKSSDFQRNFFTTLASVMKKSYTALNKLVWDLRLEAFLPYYRGFLEDGILDLLESEKKIKKIAAAVKKNKAVKKLDLSFSFIKDLPDNLADIPEISLLDLSGNPLREISVLERTCVKELNLSECALTSIPALSKYIERLDLSDNAISSLEGMGQLTNLRYLDIQNTAVSEEEVSRFKALVPGCFVALEDPMQRKDKVLIARYKHYKKLPTDFKYYTELESIDLRGSAQLDIVQALQVLSNSAATLKTIHIDASITELPEELINFKALEQVNLRFKQIERENIALSYERLTQLPNLKHLPILGGDIKLLFEHLEKFNHIEALQLNAGVFTKEAFFDAFLNKLQGFKQLKELQIDCGYSIGSEEDTTVGKFAFLSDQIKVLEIKPTYENIVPACIYDLQSLEELKINDKTLPDIQRLSSLKKLTLANPHAKTFSVTGLVNLEELYIPQLNRKWEMTGALLQLSKLKVLEIKEANYNNSFLQDLGALTKLESLNIEGEFFLFDLPDLSNCKNLQRLAIRATNREVYSPDESKPLDVFPSFITTLDKLAYLEVHCGVVEHLPSIEALKGLKELKLNISCSKRRKKDLIFTAPQGWDRLDQLKKVDLSIDLNGYEVDMLSWYEAIAQLSNLEQLKYRLTHADYILPPPASWSRLEKLKSVDFYMTFHNYESDHAHGIQSEAFFEALSLVPNLEHLVVGYPWYLKTVPSGLAKLKQLKWLDLYIDDLSQADVSKTLELLATMPKLHKLWLRTKHLPKEIALLSQVDTLQLSTGNGWGLSSFPDEFLSMIQLRVLNAHFDCSSARKKQLLKALPHCIMNQHWWGT